MAHIDELLTPIFTREIGVRLRIARMKQGIDQKELGRLLGVSQEIISRLEGGRLVVPQKPFTLARFKAVLGEAYGYVMKGTQAEKYNAAAIHAQYWNKRNARPRRTPVIPGMPRQVGGKFK